MSKTDDTDRFRNDFEILLSVFSRILKPKGVTRPLTNLCAERLSNLHYRSRRSGGNHLWPRVDREVL